MDLFTLDSQLRRTSLYDKYNSLIWTERFSSHGDFQLVINSSSATRNAFVPGTRLAVNESTRVMTVETIDDKLDSEGRALLTIKGPSLETTLHDRIAKLAMTGPNQSDKEWEITSTPAQIARFIFDQICVQGTLSASDILPFYTPGNMYALDTIPEPSETTLMKIPTQTVYQAIKQICDIYGMGFRLVRNGDTSQLMFNIYMGNDRTTQQTALSPVIFAPELDNLTDVSYLTSSAMYKNVAYVTSPNGTRIVYGQGVDSTITGLDRRVMYIDASDITDAAGATLQAKLLQRGLDNLAVNTNVSAFDGEISKYSQYRYIRDYNLGDIVEIRNSDKATNHMIVTEQIMVSDEQGERSYPTLAVKQLITPGSWYGAPATQVWDDLTSVGDNWNSRT